MPYFWQAAALPLGLLFFLSGVGRCTYSTFNALWVYGTLAFAPVHYQEAMLPLAICNTYAITVAWYVCIGLDPFFVIRLMRTYHWNAWVFGIGDVGLHVLPLLLMMHKHYGLITGAWSPVKNSVFVQYCGLYSLCIHLLWPHIAGAAYRLDPLYVSLPDSTWRFLWMLSAGTHLMTMHAIHGSLA